MSDRFDHSFEHKLESKPSGADGAAVGVRRLELITGTGRRRRWSTEDKARILFESLEPGANVSAVARRHGMSPQQLFGWRRTARTWMAESAGGSGTGSNHGPSTPSRRGRGRPKLDRSDRQSSGPPQSSGASGVDKISVQFAPVLIAAPAAAAPQVDTAVPGVIEIVVGGAVVRVSGQVEVRALAAVLAAVRKAS